jgi:CBS domain containing-hemolysin-like protein
VNPEGGSALVVAYWVGAAVMILIEAGLSLGLAAVTGLSRGALRRLGADAENGYAFLDEMDDPLSEHRSAALVMRQLCMLAACGLMVLAIHEGGSRGPDFILAGVGAIAGLLLFNVLVPRALALWNPRRALRLSAPLIRVAWILFYPLVVPVARLYRRIDTRQGEEMPEQEQEEEVEALIEAGERDGLLEAAEGAMMRSIVDLDETRVREIMTPRIDIVALPEESTVAEARGVLLEGGHSRLPVYRDSIDDTVGVLHARDLFRAWEEGGEEQPVTAYLRPAIHVPEHASAFDVLSEMRMKTKLALVLDEYGGVSGLVTLEDLLEEIVGEIRDEHEQDEEDTIRQVDDVTWDVLGVAHVEELEDEFAVDFGERDFDTVAGLVVSELGRVPKVGETCEVQGLRILVLEADRRRVIRLRVTRGEGPPENGTTG